MLITLQSSGLGGRTTGTIKTQLATFSRAFNRPWPKALPLVLLSLGSATWPFLFTKQSLVALCIWMKDIGIDLRGDILHYCQGLLNQCRETEKLVTESFYSALSGDEDLKDHGLQSDFFIYWKRHQIRDVR